MIVPQKMLSEEQLHHFQSEGLIPGPDESEKRFIERANYCLAIDKTLDHIPFSQNSRGEKSIIEEAHPITERCYGIAPTWIPLYFSNHQLAPWHGGCAWIVQLTEGAPLLL